MQIAIVGFKSKLRDHVENSLKYYLKDGGGINICQYDTPELIRPIPRDVCAIFVIVDNAESANCLWPVVNWGEGRPVVIVSNHPQYAITGIKVKVKDYILFPLTEDDMREAISRVGLEVKPDEDYRIV
jgi:two-component SAPR family response regulator